TWRSLPRGWAVLRWRSTALRSEEDRGKRRQHIGTFRPHERGSSVREMSPMCGRSSIHLQKTFFLRSIAYSVLTLQSGFFPLWGMDAQEHVVLRKRLAREALLPFVAQLPPVVIGMEACGGAHYWARRFREHGHEGKLMAPQ